MTLVVVSTSRFRKDYKREAANPKRTIGDLKAIVRALANGDALPASNRDHKLQGKLSDCRECHVTADWLLIYRVDGDELQLVRTGTHAELFGT